MASLRMLPHTVELYNRLGEVNDEVMHQRSIITRCYCYSSAASSLTTRGQEPKDGAYLYIFDKASIVTDPQTGNVRSFLPYSEWQNQVDKTPYWTLNDDDYFVMGEQKFRIRSHSHKVQGSRRMWHFEVNGK